MALLFEDHSEEELRKIDQRLNRAVDRAGLMFETEVAKRTPVLTGDLRSSTRAGDVEDRGLLKKRIQIRQTEEYAVYVEYGTIKMQPRAQFRRAADESINLISQVFISNLNG